MFTNVLQCLRMKSNKEYGKTKSVGGVPIGAQHGNNEEASAQHRFRLCFIIFKNNNYNNNNNN